MKYRHKLTGKFVEAIQYTGTNWNEVQQFTGRNVSYDKGRADATLRMAPDDGFNTLVVESGDFVVRGSGDGKLQKMAEKNFSEFYEAVQ